MMLRLVRRKSFFIPTLCALGILAFAAAPAGAQVTDTARAPQPDSVRPAPPPAEPAPQDTTQRRYRISPGQAFLRSLVLPGWGQSSIGASGRGAVYFALEAGSLWMVYTSDRKLQEAYERDRAMRDQGLLAPDATSGLTRDRRAQREDWITISVFLLFFSGADAFVAAHLRDFDEHVGVQPAPDGALRLQGNLPVGNE